MKKIYLIITILLYSCLSKNDTNLSLNNLFQDNMVIQHESVVPVWGNSKSNTEVKLMSSWGESITTTSDSKGYWKTNIKTPKADNISHNIIVTNEKEKIIINDILLGEVWLASGQSNMQWRIRQTLNSDEILELEENTNIRMITVDRNLSLKPLKTFTGDWLSCEPETISEFSAVGYFFAKKLFDELGIPIGIINSTVGGTPAESWANLNNLEKVDGFENLRERLKISNDPNSNYNTWLREHSYVERQDFINKDEIKYVDKINETFSQEEFNDTEWQSRTIKRIGEIFEKKEVDLKEYSTFHNGHNDYDGIVWMRKDFQIDTDKILSAEFDIGNLTNDGDFYSIFINGELVGRKNNWPKTGSKYKIKDGLLKNGKNSIAIRICDFYGDGGLSEDNNRGIYLNNNKLISLDGLWKSRFVAWFTNENVYKLNDGIKEIVFPSRLRISNNQGSHTVLNNSMINPLGDFTIKGVIWYQGEGNRSRSSAYTKVFTAVIDSYREQWNNENLPFYYVQLAPFADVAAKRRSSSELVAELREAQRLTLKKNNVGMAIIMDVGDSLDIHPLPKKPVGDRLALLALANDYGYDKLVFSGPLYKDVSFKNGSALINFTNVGSGLTLKNNKQNHFELAGLDKKFYEANARIYGEKVIVKSKDVINPKYVRYGWKNFLNPTLFNKEGLPASSFNSLKNPFTR